MLIKPEEFVLPSTILMERVQNLRKAAISRMAMAEESPRHAKECRIEALNLFRNARTIEIVAEDLKGKGS